MPRLWRPTGRGFGAARTFVWVVPVLVYLALATPHLNQGDFRGDLGWYSAIAVQAYRRAADLGPAGLWTLSAETATHLPDQPYFNKPPLGFWLGGVPLALFGPSLWAARLGGVLAGALCVVVTTRIAARAAGARAGLLGGCVLALTWEFVRHTRAFSLDAWQSLFLLLGVACVMRAAVRIDWPGTSARVPALGWCGASGACVGLALLCKPLAALLGAAVLCAWLVACARRGQGQEGPGAASSRRSGRAALGAAVLLIGAACVALPWHISMWRAHGDDFVSQYLGREVASRAAGALGNANRGSSSPFYYLIELAKTYWPWLIAAAPALVWGAVRSCGVLASRFSARGAPASRLAALLTLWVLAWFVALSCFADKRPRYMLVFLPELSALIAVWALGARGKGGSGVGGGIGIGGGGAGEMASGRTALRAP